MLSGKDNSGFGWDEYRQMVVAKCAMWNSYISMDVLATQPQSLKSNQDGFTSSNREKNRFLMKVNKFLPQLLILSYFWGKKY
ncbi:hypothetical protein Gohar_010499, partial [Gossypium harknessii]|nr:hypothetical protein [Gossypium harknessii]